MSRNGQRVVIVAGWLVAAVLAVLVGVVGIGLVGTGLTTRAGESVSEAQVEQELGSVSTAPTAAAESPTAAQGKGTTARSFPTRGGTVVADCDKITSMAPAQGYEVHEQSAREGEFRGLRDNHVRIKVQLTCAAGTPQIRERGES
ncbi:hypothetical protein [Actinoplanes palleronii]|uniref:hypothetical protein n=1 Tax=Actinoplanes palleronii TaxID=113570 RepID=UPI001EF2904D|nr:hypothetical protein [Actinoplanes palleronii]